MWSRQGLGGKEPWKFSTWAMVSPYDFFDQCPHRMACAKCSYLPEESSRAQMLEAKSNLLHLQHTIPLTEPELAAIDEGVAAYDKLVDSLQDVRTPSGNTPSELATTVRGSKGGAAENNLSNTAAPVEMTDGWKAKYAFHSPWKSLPRFPHSHRPMTTT